MRIWRRAFWDVDTQIVVMSAASRQVTFQIPDDLKRKLRPLLGKGDVLFKRNAEIAVLKGLVE